MKNNHYYIEYEVITPLSVGAGNDNDWVKGVDYVQKNGKLYIIDINKAIALKLSPDELSSLIMSGKEKEICGILGNSLESVSNYIFDLPASTSNPVKSFLRTQLYDKPLIAGSSIKGPIRSVLFRYLRHNENDITSVLGSMRNGSDIMRFFKISDVEMPSTILVNTKLFNLWKDDEGEWYGGWKHEFNKTTSSFKPTGFNTLYECVRPGDKGIGTIIMSSADFEKASNQSFTYLEKKSQLMRDGINALFKLINQQTSDYLKKEKAFFEQYETDRTDEIINHIDGLLKSIPNDGSSCLMKMAAGVGFHAITGDWQYNDYDDTGTWNDRKNFGKKKYKSRKIAEYRHQLQLMGFVKLRTLSDTEYQMRSALLDEEHQRYQGGILSEINKLEAKRAKEKEELERKEEAKLNLAKQRESRQRLLDEILQLKSDNQLEEALTKAQQSLGLFPEDKEIMDVIQSINKTLEIFKYKREEREKKQQLLSQPLSDIIANKTSVGNIIGFTKKWIKQEGNVFGETEYQALISALKSLKPKDLKKASKERKNMIVILGADYTNRIFNEIENSSN